MSKYDPAYYQRTKAAHRARSLRWQKNNPEKARAAMRRSRYPKPTRPEPEWCECCGNLFVKTPCLDHDHVTGKFRGWICSPCNRALGLLGDSLAGVEKALVYLRRAQ